MGRRGVIDHQTKTVFFWSQKAACQTLFATLTENYGPKPGGYVARSPKWPGCLKLIETQGYRSVILVRHPALRLVSAYFNKFVDYRGKPIRTRDDMEPFAQTLFDTARSGSTGQGRRNDLTFESFLSTVAHLHDTRADTDGNDVNGHWDTQIPPAFVRRGFDYDHVIKVEHLDRDFPPLCAALGLRYTPKQVNRTTVRDCAGVYLGQVPADALFDQQFCHRDFLTPDTLERIARIYHDDYAAFGYPTDPGQFAT